MLMLVNIPPYYAQIQTGGANAQSSVQTDIQGSGNVSTHIEVQANGQTKTLDANSPGTYRLSVSSDANNGDNRTVITPTPRLSPSPVASDESEMNRESVKKTTASETSFFTNLTKYIEDIFKRIFNKI